MIARLGSRWKKAGGHTKTIMLLALMSVLIGVLIFLGYTLSWKWTGFKEKTLWDWLNLLGVLAIPAVVGLGAAWYTAQQGKVSARENTDNQRETVLQSYIDKISELLLDKHLRESQFQDEVRTIARVRTLTTLPRLDEVRKGSVIQFLYESHLIDNDNNIVDLNGANLNGANLNDANLNGANLSRANLNGASLNDADLCNINLSSADLNGANLQSIQLGADLSYAKLSYANLSRVGMSEANLSHATMIYANLSGTNLSHATMSEADLRGADLRGADLGRADLGGANLYGAKVTAEQLDTAKSLEGAIMPDGSKHA